MQDEIPLTSGEKRAIRLAKQLEELRLKRAKAVKPKRARSPLEFIYFARSEGFVKIGWATSIETRMNSLRVNNPHPVELMALMVGGQAEEAMLHAYFRTDHHRGEWFRLSSEIQLLLNEITGLDPIDARVMAGGWFVKNAGSREVLLFPANIRALRKREDDVANLVGSVTVVLPDASISRQNSI